jgi:hypothetical protein
VRRYDTVVRLEALLPLSLAPLVEEGDERSGDERSEERSGDELPDQRLWKDDERGSPTSDEFSISVSESSKTSPSALVRELEALGGAGTSVYGFW